MLKTADGFTADSLASSTVPASFHVTAYPNPFNPATTLHYAIETPAMVTLAVFNMMGRKVTTLARGKHATGTYRVRWQARDAAGRQLPTGLYFYLFVAVPENETAVFRTSGKLLMTK